MSELVFRPATLDDARFVADVDSEVHPDDADDPQMLRHWWTLQDAEDTVVRWIVSLEGAPVGYARWDHPAWTKTPERFVRIGAELRPKWRTAERLAALYERLESEARRDEGRKVTSWNWEYDDAKLAMLRGRGYREERRERFWELDLVKERDRITKMAAESRERMRQERITLLTLAADTDPHKWEKLKRMSDEAESDVPTTVPHVPMSSLDEWKKWWDSPAIRLDRAWIAREGDDIVGISQLAYPPERGEVETDWTGTARKVRGRGVARALKCETLMQAMALGIKRVRTDNETMGYRRRPDMVQYLKEL